MTLKGMFARIYRENKRIILAYVTLCMVFSIFMYGYSAGNQVNAKSTAEVVGTIGGNFGVVSVPLVQNFCGAIDTPTTLLFMSGISLAFELVPDEKIAEFGNKLNIDGLENYSFGILDYHWFQIFVLVWFVMSKLSRSNRVSYTAGVIFEDIESKLGGFVQILCAAVQVFANVPAGSAVHAAGIDSATQNAVTKGMNALTCFLILMILLIVFFFVRVLFYAADISMCILCSFIPFTGVSMETAKSLLVGFLLYMAVFHPIVFYGTAFFILLLAVVLFKRTYTALCYFKKIYIKPIFRRLRGFDASIPLVAPKMPRKLRAFIQNDNPGLVIPVYLIKKIPGFKKAHRYERWWIVSGESRQYLCRPRFFSKECLLVLLHNEPDCKLFVKKSVRFFEVFQLAGTEEKLGQTFYRVKKKLHFVFSREYTKRFDEIKDITQWIDYTEYVNQIKREAKEAKKQAREESRERLKGKLTGKRKKEQI